MFREAISNSQATSESKNKMFNWSSNHEIIAPFRGTQSYTKGEQVCIVTEEKRVAIHLAKIIHKPAVACCLDQILIYCS